MPEIIKSLFCHHIKKNISMVITEKQYMNQVDLILTLASGKKTREDPYLNFRCDKHCFTGKTAPEDCWYKELDSLPICEAVCWISNDRTNAIVKDSNPLGGTIYSHQVKLNNKWGAHCQQATSKNAVLATCILIRKYKDFDAKED